MRKQIAALLKGGELKLKSLDPGEMFREGFLPGTLRIYPQDVRGEGHFVALLQKKGGEEAAAQIRRSRQKKPQGVLLFPQDLNPLRKNI